MKEYKPRINKYKCFACLLVTFVTQSTLVKEIETLCSCDYILLVHTHSLIDFSDFKLSGFYIYIRGEVRSIYRILSRIWRWNLICRSIAKIDLTILQNRIFAKILQSCLQIVRSNLCTSIAKWSSRKYSRSHRAWKFHATIDYIVRVQYCSISQSALLSVDNSRFLTRDTRNARVFPTQRNLSYRECIPEKPTLLVYRDRYLLNEFTKFRVRLSR